MVLMENSSNSCIIYVLSSNPGLNSVVFLAGCIRNACVLPRAELAPKMIAGMPALLLPAQQYVETVPLITQKPASLIFLKLTKRSVIEVLFYFCVKTCNHGLINYIGTKAKCRHPNKLTCKGTLRQVFICLRPRTAYPIRLRHCIPCIKYTYSYREGGGGGRVEPERSGEGHHRRVQIPKEG